ncbi:MAG: hypothetical protein IJT44_05390 [Clostridia bacterium]|nr:hypothetical protein [Clostridia bacterium]
MEKETNIPIPKKKNVWLPIVVIVGVLAVLLALLIVIVGKVGQNGSQPAPVMVAGSSHFEMYETRTDTVLLTYSITLRNETDQDLRGFALRGVLQTDYNKGYILSPEATVRQWGEVTSTFTIKSGEAKTYDLILTAKYHRTQRTASRELPQLYAVYPDGSEGLIEIVDE